MYVCPNCKYQSSTPMHFCFNCGTKTVFVDDQQPQYQPPQYQQPYQQSTYYPAPQRSNNLGRKIPGMIMGILGFVTALIGLIYVLLFVAAETGAFGFGFSIGIALESLPLSIIGRVLCRRCIDEGDNSKMAGAGSGLGLAGIILTIVMLALGFLSLATI